MGNTNHELTGSSSISSLSPTSQDRVNQWRQEFQIHNQWRQPINPSKLITDGPESQPVGDLDEKDFQNLFFQVMSQGVAPDDNGYPHFFTPKTFLESTHHRVPKSAADYRNYAHGLDSITLFKNLPEYQSDLTLQQAAKTAIAEYLDPDLFDGNFTYDSELPEIFNWLGSEALEDPDIMAAFNAATLQRNEKSHASRERAIARARKTDYQRVYEPTPNPGSFRINSKTTIGQVLDKLKDSSNRVGFERVNAL